MEGGSEREFNQHFTPPLICAQMVNLARQSFPETTLWLEPCAGDCAIFSLLPEPRLAFDIDSSVASRHGYTCRDFNDLALSDLTGSDITSVCVVTNPPFNEKALYTSNRRASGGKIMIQRFIEKMRTIATSAVLLLPSTIHGRTWWEKMPKTIVHEEDLGRVRFGNTKGADVHVFLIALRFDGETTGTKTPSEDSFADELVVTTAGDPLATAAMVRWGSPAQLGNFTFDAELIATAQEKLNPRQRGRRASATRLFFRVHKPEIVAKKLTALKRVLVERFRKTTNTSLSVSLADFLEIYSSIKID